MSHHVYRIFDASGRLLYVGATSNLPQRIAEHEATKAFPGCHPVLTIGERMARWTADEHPTRKDAFAAEREAIRAEQPELNTYGASAKMTEKPTATPLASDYTLEEVASALRMSTRWVRDRIKEGKDKDHPGPVIAHERRGHKIVFTAEQVAAFRNQFTDIPAALPADSITTGRKKSA